MKKTITSSFGTDLLSSPESLKEIPPIKAPVGLAKGPDLKHVSSKIGSLDNVKHKPGEYPDWHKTTSQQLQ